jgi:hypothetical protein
MSEKQQPASSQAALSSARLQHFNYIERRHYSFDTDTEARRFSSSTAPVMDYDQTEGLGGLSVSSYDSIDDDRSPIDPAVRGYHYHGEFTAHSSDVLDSSMIYLNSIRFNAVFCSIS